MEGVEVVLKKIILIKAAQVPLGGRIRPSGFTTEVDEDTFVVLRDRGVLADGEAPEVVEDLGEAPEVVEEVAAAPEVEKPSGKSYPQIPKKTAGVNVLREYARDNEIDIRGLSDKPEIMGHLIKVTGQ